MWYRNLEKWQKGGLIGLGVGIILGCIAAPPMVWIPNVSSVSVPVVYLHLVFANIVRLITITPVSMGGYEYYTIPVAIAVFYGGVGAAAGKLRQISITRKRRILTGLLVLLMLLVYFSSLLTYFYFRGRAF